MGFAEKCILTYKDKSGNTKKVHVVVAKDKASVRSEINRLEPGYQPCQPPAECAMAIIHEAGESVDPEEGQPTIEGGTSGSLNPVAEALLAGEKRLLRLLIGTI